MIANTPLFHTSLNNTDNIHSVHQHPTTFCWFLQSDTIQSCQNYLLGMTCPVILTTAIFYKPSILNLDILSKQSQISKIFNYTYFWFALDLAMQDKTNHDDTNKKLNLTPQINKLEMTHKANNFSPFPSSYTMCWPMNTNPNNSKIQHYFSGETHNVRCYKYYLNYYAIFLTILFLVSNN